jgi:hypothetical protein
VAIPPPNFAGRQGRHHPAEVSEEELPELPAVSLAKMGEIADNVLATMPGSVEVAFDGEDDSYWEPTGTLEGAKAEAEKARAYWDDLAARTKDADPSVRVTRPRSIEVVECPHCHSFWVVVSGRSKAYPGGQRYGCRNIGNKGRRCPGVANIVKARY